MHQTTDALDYFNHLLNQGVPREGARLSTRLRFGVDMGAIPWTGYGTGFAETTYGTSTGPVDGLRGSYTA